MLEFVEDELILRAALDAQLERTKDAEFEVYAFNRLLRAAIDTEYIAQLGSRRSAGLDWMRSKKTDPDPEVFTKLARVTQNPVEMFTAHNEYNPHISDVVCSCLFETFIPQGVRDDFARNTVGKWGPKKSNWSRFAVFGDVSHSTRAEITHLLASTNTVLMDRTRYVNYLASRRSQEMWNTSREWSILNDSNTFNVALACLSHAPKLALGTSTAKQIAFVPYLESILGKHAVRYLIEKALENYAAVHGKVLDLASLRATHPAQQPVEKTRTAELKTEPQPVAAERKSLDAQIDEALKTGIIHRLRTAVHAHMADDTFVDDYRVHYHKRIRESKSKWVKQVTDCFRHALFEAGWHSGKVALEEWQGKLRAYVHVPFRGRKIRYVQRHGSYLPQQGEEVIYRPDTCHGIALDLYVVTFMPLVV